MARGQASSGRGSQRGRGRGRGRGRANYSASRFPAPGPSSHTPVLEAIVQEGGRLGTKRKNLADDAPPPTEPAGPELRPSAPDDDLQGFDFDPNFGGPAIQIPHNAKKKRIRKWGNDNGVRPLRSYTWIFY